MSGELIYVDEEEPLIDVADFAFERHDVTIRKDKWVTDEFDIFEMLGKGKFGEVKRCTEISTGRQFAAKFIRTSTPQDEEDVRHEVHIMKVLHHKRLLQLYDAFQTKNMMCLVLEVILGGELFDRVICEDFVLTEKACVCFMRQICEGVEYMHDHNIIHLDMKPENILCLTRTGNRVKIIDFGLAREYNPKKELRVLFGTPEFMAPEVVNYETITFATDMWSVGVICYVLLSGLSPFMGDEDGDTLTNVIKGEYDFNYKEFDEVSEAAKDMIEKLLLIDKKKRLTARQCLEHPWLKHDAPPKSPNLDLSKANLKQYVHRRRWQKGFHAIVALRRMGVDLETLMAQHPDGLKKPAVAPKPINGKKSDLGSSSSSSNKPAMAPKPKWKMDKVDKKEDKATNSKKNNGTSKEDNNVLGQKGKGPSSLYENNIEAKKGKAGFPSLFHENSIKKKKGKVGVGVGVEAAGAAAPSLFHENSIESSSNNLDPGGGDGDPESNDTAEPVSCSPSSSKINNNNNNKSEEGSDERKGSVCSFGAPVKRSRGFDINKHRGSDISKVQSFGLVFGGTVKQGNNKITSQSNSDKENGPAKSPWGSRRPSTQNEEGDNGGPGKPPVAPKPRGAQGHHAHHAKKWQKGSDRYIVMNRVHDHVKFFTVNDPREVNHMSDDDMRQTRQKFLPKKRSS